MSEINIEAMKDRVNKRLQLDEKFFTSFKAEAYEEVFINPTHHEMIKLPAWTEFGEVKFLVYKNDIYMWGSENPTTHTNVEKEIKIAPADSIRMYYDCDNKKLKIMQFGTRDPSMVSVNPDRAREELKDMKSRFKNLFVHYTESFEF